MLGSIRARRRSFAQATPQRARERLEHRLDLVMARAAVEHLDVDVGPRADGEAFEEIVDQLGLQIADPHDLHLQVDDRVRPPAEIDRGDRAASRPSA